jgi:hypothetical protein
MSSVFLLSVYLGQCFLNSVPQNPEAPQSENMGSIRKLYYSVQNNNLNTIVITDFT